MNAPIRLAVVIPCFNEAEVLPETASRMRSLLRRLQDEGRLGSNSYVLLVDDGSTDATWALIEQLHGEKGLFRGLRLSRNFGHQNALLAGILHASDADAVVSIDADLQDDPEALVAMLEKYAAGYDVVYGVRNDRRSDSWLKRNTALLFYRFFSRLGVQSVNNHADYRFMSRRVLDAFSDFGEVNLYLRGLMPLVGFRQTTVAYERGSRFAGESKYSFRKMLSFAWDGITSLSVRPLHFVTLTGFLVFLISLGLTAYALISYVFFDTEHGWASTVIPLYFLGGVQLLCIGVIGEYVGKIYREVKQRPRFIVEEHLK